MPTPDMHPTAKERPKAPRPVPATMRAATIRRRGDFDVLVPERLATPSPRAGEVLIRVLASGVNRLDHSLREGSVPAELPSPHVLGADASGEVAALGPGTRGFEVGERVLVLPGYIADEQERDVRPITAAPSFVLPGLHVPGAYAEFMAVPAAALARDRTDLAPTEAASLPMVLGSSVRAVRSVGRVRGGDRVLIQAGASGSGSMQIQVAKALGAEVATTVRSDDKIAFATDAGADLVVNTRTTDPVEVVRAWTGGRGVDVAVDNLGGDVLARSLAAVRPMGTVVAYGFAAGAEVTFDVRDLFFEQKELRGSMAADPEDLEWGLDQVRLGRIRPLVDRTFPLSKAADAHRYIASNRVRGNVVLLPSE